MVIMTLEAPPLVFFCGKPNKSRLLTGRTTQARSGDAVSAPDPCYCLAGGHGVASCLGCCKTAAGGEGGGGKLESSNIESLALLARGGVR